MLPILVAIALSQPQAPSQAPPSLDQADAAARTHIDAPELNSQILAAMALPYRYGVTQIPCPVRDRQPEREWRAAREPAGKVSWVTGATTRVAWAGIYGTCFIHSPVARDKVPEVERMALECICDGWLPGR